MKWTLVRTFGNVKYFNISYLVLAVVPVLHEVYIQSDKWFLWVGSSWDISPELKWAYAASVAFAIGIAIYQLFCPSEVKTHPEAKDYVDAELDHWVRSYPHRRLEIALAQLDSTTDRNVLQKIGELRTAARAENGNSAKDAHRELNELLEQLAPTIAQRFLEANYNEKNTSRPLAIWSAAVLYFFGIGIILILLALKSYTVLFDTLGENMLIRTYWEDHLLMDAYTYDVREFDSLEAVLRRAEASTAFKLLNSDEYDRQGRRYAVDATLVGTLGQVLSGTFDPRGYFSIGPGTGKTYACQQLARGGQGPGCQELVASDDDVATTQCAIIAGQKKWWGGAAVPGRCSKKRSMFGWVGG